jgi:hypothetical protein
MEKYTTSLEISKKLVEAGWNKEAKFWWVKTVATNCFELAIKVGDIFRFINGMFGEGVLQVSIEDKYPSPLATEILEELPDLRISKGDNYVIAPDDGGLEIDKSLPNALAKMWLYLAQQEIFAILPTKIGGKN